MDLGRIIKTTLVAGIVANAIDYVSFTFLFTSYMQLPFMNPMPPIAWLVAAAGAVFGAPRSAQTSPA